MGYYNRYTYFRKDGRNMVVPRITIEPMASDLVVVFDKSKMRLDNLSYKYYADPDYGWLIMLANPAAGSMEFLIPDGYRLRIPYPLSTAINRYESQVQEYLKSQTD